VDLSGTSGGSIPPWYSTSSKQGPFRCRHTTPSDRSLVGLTTTAQPLIVPGQPAGPRIRPAPGAPAAAIPGSPGRFAGAELRSWLGDSVPAASSPLSSTTAGLRQVDRPGPEDGGGVRIL